MEEKTPSTPAAEAPPPAKASSCGNCRGAHGPLHPIHLAGEPDVRPCVKSLEARIGELEQRSQSCFTGTLEDRVAALEKAPLARDAFVEDLFGQVSKRVAELEAKVAPAIAAAHAHPAPHA